MTTGFVLRHVVGDTEGGLTLIQANVAWETATTGARNITRVTGAPGILAFTDPEGHRCYFVPFGTPKEAWNRVFAGTGTIRCSGDNLAIIVETRMRWQTQYLFEPKQV